MEAMLAREHVLTRLGRWEEALASLDGAVAAAHEAAEPTIALRAKIRRGAILRPRELARAIERAFGYHARPYDFDFDFYTDTSLVCS